MRDIIVAFCVGMGLASSVLAGEEDLRTGGPWILTLIVFPACALLCLAFIIRDHRRRVSAEERRSDSAEERHSDSVAEKRSNSSARAADRDARSSPFS
ncbi:hypothetical protein [Brevibacterium sp. CFH 10365]|uniref:hypothetical protein n=1 Tax=Brevibacterium sp. CFH 10365 TaxID=2585207 RepID=UPI0012662B7D|nr:hypothetical protein [Brevibacterium sp. CFH 10365]